jgi:hypothetical protein
MKAHVVGYQTCDFKDRDGKQVQGVSLKCLVDSTTSETLVGQDIAKIWIPMKLLESVGFVPDVGSDVNLVYDYDGRKSVLVGYELIKSDKSDTDS